MFDCTGQTVRLRSNAVPSIFPALTKNPRTITEEEVKPSVQMLSQLDRKQTNIHIQKTGKKRKHQPTSLEERGDDIPLIRKSARIMVCGRKKWTDLNEDSDETTETMAKVEIGEESTRTNNNELKVKVHCYVCNKVVEGGTLLKSRTATTKTEMHQKLAKVAAAASEIIVEEEGALCSLCARVLNYIDRIEVELNTLQKTVINQMHKKNASHKILDKRQQESSDNVSKRVSSCGRKKEIVGTLPCHLEENTKIMKGLSNKCENTTALKPEHKQRNIPKTNSSKVFECIICNYETIYKSVMIFHLRQHVTESLRCDFCNVSLPENSIPEHLETSGITKTYASANKTVAELPTICATKIEKSNIVEAIVKEVEISADSAVMSDEVITADIRMLRDKNGSTYNNAVQLVLPRQDKGISSTVNIQEKQHVFVKKYKNRTRKVVGAKDIKQHIVLNDSSAIHKEDPKESSGKIQSEIIIHVDSDQYQIPSASYLVQIDNSLHLGVIGTATDQQLVDECEQFKGRNKPSCSDTKTEVIPKVENNEPSQY